MATESAVQRIGSLTASADLRTHQFKGVKISGVRTVTVIALATDKVLGILQNKPNTAEPADVAISGEVLAMAGAAITAGADLMFDTSGRVITAATTGNRVIGQAIDSAAAAGEIISIALGACTVGRLLP